MKSQDALGCLGVIAFLVVFMGALAVIGSFTPKVHERIATPAPTRTAAPVYRGPSPDDCRRETDERRANACWEYIDDWYSSRQEMEMERDYYQDDPSYDDPEYYDPFEDGRFVDGP